MRRLAVAVAVLWAMVAANAAAAPTFVPWPTSVGGRPGGPTTFAPDAAGGLLMTGGYELAAVDPSDPFAPKTRGFFGRLLASGESDPHFPTRMYDPEAGGWPRDSAPPAGNLRIAVQPDGRILLLGGGYAGRVYADASADPSFHARHWEGSDLRMTLRDATLLGDGGILQTGWVHHDDAGRDQDIAFARLASDGTFDTTYGDAGRLVVPLSRRDAATYDFEEVNLIEPAADGGAYVGLTAGQGIDVGFAALARVDRSGRLVKGFGRGDGILVLDLPGTTDAFMAVAEQPDGHLLTIVARSVSSQIVGTRYGIYRFDASGRPDATYGAAQLDPMLIPGGGYPSGLALDPRDASEAVILIGQFRGFRLLRLDGMTLTVRSGFIPGPGPPAQADQQSPGRLFRLANAGPDRLVTPVSSGEALVPRAGVAKGWLAFIDLNDLPPPEPLPPPAPAPPPPPRYSLTLHAGAGGAFGRPPGPARAAGVGEPVSIRLRRTGGSEPESALFTAPGLTTAPGVGCHLSSFALCGIDGGDASTTAVGRFERPGARLLATSLLSGFRPAAPPRPGPRLTVHVHDPRSSVTTANARRVAGRARPRAGAAAERIVRVDVAVARVAGKRCRWLDASNRHLPPRRCDRPRWRRAKGTRRWELPLRNPLLRGRYLVHVRAIDRAGVHERGPAKPEAGRRTFRVR